VLTEILTRYERGMLPDHFNNFFRKVVFTNGGMVYDLINFRLSQTLLLSPLGPYLAKVAAGIKQFASVQQKTGFQQLATLWSSDNRDRADTAADIRDIQMLNRLNGGDTIVHLTISYLRDRSRLEPRWLRSLGRLDHLSFLLLWGDDDAVSPLSIPRRVMTRLPPTAKMETIKAGHFLMLEDPTSWARHIIDFISAS